MKIFLIMSLFCLLPFGVYATNLGQIGNTYKIIEKNILEVVKDRAANTDWSSMRENSKKELSKTVGKVDKRLPKATDNATYYVDMTRSLDKNIYIRDELGKPKILYPKGYTYNVLDYTTLSQRFLFFDGERTEEIAWFKANFGKDLSVMPIITAGSAVKLSDDIKREVYIIDDALIQTFRLKATPTMVYQEKNKLRADEFYLMEAKE